MTNKELIEAIRSMTGVPAQKGRKLKYTKEVVTEIVRAKRRGVTYAAISKETKISPTYITKLVKKYEKGSQWQQF